MGHSCSPEAVKSGHCSKCGARWIAAATESELQLRGLQGRDIRGKDGRKRPLI